MASIFALGIEGLLLALAGLILDDVIDSIVEICGENRLA
jgi:hypothetical protein